MQLEEKKMESLPKKCRRIHNVVGYRKYKIRWWIVGIEALIILFSNLVDSFIIQRPNLSLLSESFTHHPKRRRILLSSSSTGLEDEYDYEDAIFSLSEVEALNVPQLKQQLRLRGLKVSGKKQELVDRLWNFFNVQATEKRKQSMNFQSSSSTSTMPVEQELLSELESVRARRTGSSRKSKALEFAEARGKELIDVTAYLDDEDKGKSVKSSIPDPSNSDEMDDDPESREPETWGSEAKIVDDFEGKTPIVDALSRTIVEFKGSNQTMVQAYVVGSRDALKPFLAGGKNRTGDPEARLREIQLKREQAAKRPVRFEDEEGIDEGDETGIYADILHRDFSDWGKYTLTGAQISAQEVQGVLLLSDVYGAFTDDTKTLAEKIAFECQPVVVMVPDLFRGKPWKEDQTTPGFNEEGQDYEEWRNMHSDLRVSVDIRAASAILREQYGVSSVVVWGTCFGGGRALEVAAGHLPGGKIHDVDGTIGPLPVKPEVVVAWYPTRYDAKALFGKSRIWDVKVPEGERTMAVIGIFAGNDQLQGATPNDAALLKSLLEADNRVKDYMVKIFPNQDHGFAHSGLGQRHDESDLDRFVDQEFGGAGRVSMDSSDAEVACLLSTAFMETYSRVFLPTTGPPISKDELSNGWNAELEIKNFRQQTRDIRKEIEESLENFKEEPLSGRRIDPADESQRDELAAILRTMEPENVPPEYKIQDDDDLETIYAKLKASDDSFQIF